MMKGQNKVTRVMARTLLIVSALALQGCNMVLLNPAGDVARQQSDLLVASTWLMLLIVVPVIVLTLWFAWRYRESNSAAKYTPDWDHSTLIELYVWAAPLLIIIALGAMTWINTHTLDPYRALDRVGPGRPVPEGVEPLRVQAVALEWKWLFIYPDYGVATVNELAAPIDRPIRFQTTSPKMMNSLFIPTLAGMVYAMPGMETLVHAVINVPGEYHGVSGNYSGAGYSDMRFGFHGLSEAEFEAWLNQIRSAPQSLDTPTYLRLSEASRKDPVQYFSSVEAGLYHRILNLCTSPDRMCMDDMMANRSHRHEAPVKASPDLPTSTH